MNGCTHNLSAFVHELPARDRVELLDQLASFHCKLPSIRRILLNLVDDHVKHVPDHVKRIADHVKLRVELPCSTAITSNFAWNSLLTRDHVKLRLELPCLRAIASNFIRNFLARARSRQTALETSLDHTRSRRNFF